MIKIEPSASVFAFAVVALNPVRQTGVNMLLDGIRHVGSAAVDFSEHYLSINLVTTGKRLEDRSSLVNKIGAIEGRMKAPHPPENDRSKRKALDSRRNSTVPGNQMDVQLEIPLRRVLSM